MYIDEDLPYKEKTCYASLEVWLYSTIKTSKDPQKIGTHNLPFSSTLEL